MEETYTDEEKEVLVEKVTLGTRDFVDDVMMPMLDLRSNYLYAEYGVEIACYVSTDPHYILMETLLVNMGVVHDKENFKEIMDELMVLIDSIREDIKK